MAQLKQISRPFQIALVAVIVLFALWLVVLRHHASSESSSSSASSAQPATSPQPAASSSSAGSSGSSGSSASPSSTYTGSAPGVGGLTRAIAKARGAVAQSQQNAQRLQSKEQQASSATSAAQATAAKPASSTSAKSSAAVTPAPARAKAAPQSAAKPSSGAASSATRVKAGIPALQSQVEAQLKHGRLVAILLWNPKGSVDKLVRSNLQGAERSFPGKLAVHVATSGQVGSFGTFTRTVQVYSTPTILLINPKGATSSVTGLTDAFAIDQAIREAKLAA